MGSRVRPAVAGLARCRLRRGSDALGGGLSEMARPQQRRDWLVRRLRRLASPTAPAVQVAQRWPPGGVCSSSHMDWRHIREILAAGDDVGLELKNMIVWNKDN